MHQGLRKCSLVPTVGAMVRIELPLTLVPIGPRISSKRHKYMEEKFNPEETVVGCSAPVKGVWLLAYLAGRTEVSRTAA
jgi:hypothetical protein